MLEFRYNVYVVIHCSLVCWHAIISYITLRKSTAMANVMNNSHIQLLTQ